MKKSTILIWRMFIFAIMIMPLVSADTDFLNLSQDNANQARTDMRGNLITPIVNNLTITAQTYSATTATKAQLWMKTGAGTGVSLQNVTISSGNATFTTQMNTSTRYYITADADGGAYEARANNTATGHYPRLNTQLNTSASVAMSAGEYTDQTEVWRYFFTSNASVSPATLYPNHTMWFPNATTFNNNPTVINNASVKGIAVNLTANNISSFIIRINGTTNQTSSQAGQLYFFLYERNLSGGDDIPRYKAKFIGSEFEGFNATVNYNFNKSKLYLFLVGTYSNWYDSNNPIGYYMTLNNSDQAGFYSNTTVNVSNNSHYDAYASAVPNQALYTDQIENLFWIFSSNQTYLNATLFAVENLSTHSNHTPINFSGQGFSSRVYNNGLNVTMFSNISGSWAITAYNSTAYSSADTNFSMNINAGVYQFAYRVNDTQNITWSENRTFTVFSQVPLLLRNFPNYTLPHFSENTTNLTLFFQNFDSVILTYKDLDNNLTRNVSSENIQDRWGITSYVIHEMIFASEVQTLYKITSSGKNVNETPLFMYACNSNISVCIVSNTFYLTINQSSQAPTFSFIKTASDGLGRMFPNSESLSFPVKFAIVFVVLLVLSILVFLGASSVKMDSKLTTASVIIIDALAFFFLASIGYVPMGILIFLIIVALIILLFKTKS